MTIVRLRIARNKEMPVIIEGIRPTFLIYLSISEKFHPSLPTVSNANHGQQHRDSHNVAEQIKRNVEIEVRD